MDKFLHGDNRYYGGYKHRAVTAEGYERDFQNAVNIFSWSEGCIQCTKICWTINIWIFYFVKSPFKPFVYLSAEMPFSYRSE